MKAMHIDRERLRVAVRRPKIAYYQWLLRRGGVEAAPYVWISGRPDVALCAGASCSIGNDTFIPTSIQIRGNDRGRIVVGERCSIDSWSRLFAANEATLKLEDGVAVGPFNIINAFDDCTIGENSMLGPYVNINCADHGTEMGGDCMRFQAGCYGPVVIEGDCWICSHVVILRGVTIGRGSVVAAGSVVNCDLPPYSIAAGVPAKVVGSRED